MASDLVPAIWDGPFGAELPDGSLVAPGEQHLVTTEDLKSAHWKPVPKGGAKARAESTEGAEG